MNYDQVIEEGLKEGLSFEQIAAAFSNALNKKEQEASETGRRRKLNDEYIDRIEHFLFDDDSDVSEPLDVAACAAAFYVLNNKSWSIETVKYFFNDIKAQIQAVIALYDGAETDDEIKNLIFKMYQALHSAEKKQEKKEKEKKGETDRVENAEEEIRKFLRALDL